MERRVATVERKTSETEIQLSVNLDGQANFSIDTPVYFLNHMLELFSYHSGFDLEIEASGDTEIDNHHIVEDIALVLGEAFRKAIGDKGGINRYANIHLPMDETLILVVVDISGRPHLSYGLEFQNERVGQFETALFREFFKSFVNESKITLHLRQLSGTDPHHIAEATFKGLARSLREAVRISGDTAKIPSSKGKL
ncbi:imidazoleglycerol-phosphate dehydratase HisB [Natranaerobius thermophilus]|uniref:Imidazoleglycerol-phosphate dehydratase n=1 Tax=Natranaerobius thermophilus (strain ATCC BAA-1301 / DSM 18059 / JW/NM-WN-LF) TaxID=457570 RepID=B2A6X3_NATTJ|nr:imidazoleglycerol-phosphate dehydratase HisB [Natranaerobius thermophilus]ACB85567.1 imidazoleglycerol-phosphate dehydratase [Natranaerobius thermophilus JW/NM-WN-LF]